MAVGIRAVALALLPLLLLQSSAQSQEISVVGYAKVPALAVYQDNNGSYVGSVLWIEVRIVSPGNGVVYVSTEPLSDIDLQASGRAAVMIASYLAGVDPFSYDYLIYVRADAPIVGGPSAGAAMTAAVYSALTGKRIDPRVAATGMILPDGLIGPVGGVPEKAVAAASQGYKVILVPQGQSIYSETRYVQQRIGPITVLRPTTVTINVSDLVKGYGARVVEVSLAEDLVSIFTGSGYGHSGSGVEPFLLVPEIRVLEEAYKGFLNLSRGSREAAQASLARVGNPTIASIVASYIQSSASYENSSLDLYNKGLYYPALSSIFTSYYMARFAENLAKAYSSASPASYAQGLISSVESMHRGAMALWKGYVDRESYTLSQIFIFPEVFQRLYDVGNSLNLSSSVLSSGNVVDAVYYASYAEARIRSIDPWLSLASTGPAFSISRGLVSKISQWIYSYARTSLSYLESLETTTGYQAGSTPIMEQILAQASYLLTAGDLLGSLSLSMNVLTNSSVIIHNMFSINLTDLSRTLRTEIGRALAQLGNASPVSSRIYTQMGDYLATTNPQASIGLYEEALMILRVAKLLIIGQGWSNSTGLGQTSFNPPGIQGQGNGGNTSSQKTPSTVSRTASQSEGILATARYSGLIIAVALTIITLSAALTAYIYLRKRPG